MELTYYASYHDGQRADMQCFLKCTEGEYIVNDHHLIGLSFSLYWSILKTCRYYCALLVSVTSNLWFWNNKTRKKMSFCQKLRNSLYNQRVPISQTLSALIGALVPPKASLLVLYLCGGKRSGSHLTTMGRAPVWVPQVYFLWVIRSSSMFPWAWCLIACRMNGTTFIILCWGGWKWCVLDVCKNWWGCPPPFSNPPFSRNCDIYISLHHLSS